MTAKKVWSHFLIHGRGDPLFESAAIKSLTNAGMSTYEFDPDEPCCSGVLFFDEVTQPLCSFLREVSRNGLERVLAITASRSALASGNAWRLLEAGASDVFAWDHSADPAKEVATRFERWDSVDRLGSVKR